MIAPTREEFDKLSQTVTKQAAEIEELRRQMQALLRMEVARECGGGRLIVGRDSTALMIESLRT